MAMGVGKPTFWNPPARNCESQGQIDSGGLSARGQEVRACVEESIQGVLSGSMMSPSF